MVICAHPCCCFNVVQGKIFPIHEHPDALTSFRINQTKVDGGATICVGMGTIDYCTIYLWALFRIPFIVSTVGKYHYCCDTLNRRLFCLLLSSPHPPLVATCG